MLTAAAAFWLGLAAAAVGVAAVWALSFRRRLRRDRRRAEELRASEERWKFALEGAGDGVWDTDLVHRTTLYSRRWKEMLGYGEEEIGNSMEEWTGRIHPEDRERVLQENRNCISGRADGFISEFRMRAKDGRWIWVMDRGKVVERAADGTALRMIGTHTDISARKLAQAREAARGRVLLQIATGASLADILESIVHDVESRTDWRSSIMLVDAKRSTLITGAAPSLPLEWLAAIDGLAIAADNGCCGTAAHTARRVVVDDIRQDPRWVSFRGAAERAGLLACWSEPILAADGTVLGTLANYRDRPSAPTLEEIESVVDAAQIAAIAIERRRDIQALRESEALLSAKSRTLEVTLERMEQGVMMVNADRVVEVCNRRAIELLGLPPELMATHPPFHKVLEYQWSTNEFQHTPEDLREFVRKGGILDQPQRYERQRPDGRYIEVQSVPIERGGVLRTYTDVTDRKQAEALREALEAQLLEARKLEAIGTLAGGIAHDFNNILAAILGNAELARQALDPEHPSRAFLHQITKAGQRARSLVQQILAFSRQEPSRFASVRLAPLIEETVAMLRTTAGPEVRIQVEVADRSLAVMGDATQLQQLLMNLATNAWQALRGAPGSIEIGLDEREIEDGEAATRGGLEPGSYVRLWVRDDGCGMDEATRRRIFEPFFTTKPVGQGTGLGLAVVHGIVRSLGGAIDVTSAPGEGSLFELLLPEVDHESRPTPLDAVPSGPVGRGQRVLYIDDDEVMAVMVQGLLQHLGYAGTCTRDAQQAIDLVARDPSAFDAVVTDFNMPGRTGLDVARELAAIRPDLPVVISTGFASDELRAQAARLGVRAVMQKEHTLEELGAVLVAALDSGQVAQP